MNLYLLLAKKSISKLPLQVSVVVGFWSAISTTPAQAVPINCNDIYFSDSGNFVNPNVLGGLYYISTIDGVDALVGRFPNSIIPPTQTNRAGGTIAIIGGASPKAYASSNTFATAGSNLQSIDVNGANGTNLPNATLTVAANGMAAAPDGTLQYLANVGGIQKLYKFPNLNSASVLVGTITPPAGDNIFNTLVAGDNAFDGNGRHYYFASPSSNYNVGYLYYIDPTLQAHLLGSVPTIGGATGLAFDSAGNLYTSSQGKLDKIIMTNGFGVIQIIGTPAHSIIDMASCSLPSLNPLFDPINGISKKVRNTTTPIVANQAIGTENTGVVGDVLEYQITIKNTGNIPSDTTKFIDSIPVGTTYKPASTQMCDSTGTTCTPVADLAGNLAPFTAPGGMEVHTYSTTPVAGLVNAGVTSAVVVKFQVTVTATTGSVVNTGTLTYPVASSAGAFTTNSQNSGLVRTILSVSVSGKVWNDVDGSGNGGFNLITTPPGEVGTNAGGLYAILVDGTTPNKVIGSTVIAANGTYAFPTVTPNQSGLKIQLSTIPVSPLPNLTIPPAGVPTPWKSTTNTLVGITKQPITTPFNVGLVDVPNKDFGITLPAGVILVKRITAINGLTTNPNDQKDLNVMINSPDTTNDDPTRRWPAGYLKGQTNAGYVKPGDTIEYTIYYLNDSGADAKTLKICDPIRGKQTYLPNSMKMLPGGVVDLPANRILLTDGVDLGVDRANSYAAGAANVPAKCNAASSTATGTDNGGVAIEITGTGANPQPDLPVLNGATATATSNSSYGWFKFTTKVNP
jgi:uncharacterized repeat protein (TIGR01451 family)